MESTDVKGRKFQGSVGGDGQSRIFVFDSVDCTWGIATLKILLNTSSIGFTCAHCSDIICMKVLREALNQCISKCISKNQRPVRYLVKKQTTISPCFSLRYSQCSWIYERLGKVLQSYYFFFLSLINMTPFTWAQKPFFCVIIWGMLHEKIVRYYPYAIGRVLKRRTCVQVSDPKGLQRGSLSLLPVTSYLHGWYWFEVLQLLVKQRLTALLFKCRVLPNVNSLQDQISPPTWSSWAQDAGLQASLIA